MFNANRTPLGAAIFAVALLSGIFFSTVTMPLQSAPNQLSVGDPIPQMSFRNQWDRFTSIQPGHELILFSAEKEVSDVLHKYLNSRGRSFLNKHGVIYIADIHRMPYVITHLVALPRMRDYTYGISLLYTAKKGLVFPRKKGKATLLHVENGTISKIEYISPENVLREVR